MAKELWGRREAARHLHMSIGFVEKLVLIGEMPTLAKPVMGTLVREGTVPGPPNIFGRSTSVPATAVVEDMKYFDADEIRAWGPKWRERYNASCVCLGKPFLVTDDDGRVLGKRPCEKCGGTGDGEYRRELAPKLEAFGRPDATLVGVN